MNHRESTHPHSAARAALRALSLLLLPTLAPYSADALPRSQPGGSRSAAPYLPAVGAPHLRFQEAAPPPDLVARPPAAAPPQPALTSAENSIAADNASAARSVTAADQPAESSPPQTPVPEAAPSTAETENSQKTIPPILRDDVRPQIRPEDFLPFFQIPGSAQQAGDVTLLVPAPFSAPTGAPLPPSSATYTQTPK